MKLKKIVLILLLTLALFSISSVSAQNIDVNTTNDINPLNEVLSSTIDGSKITGVACGMIKSYLNNSANLYTLLITA